MRLVVRCALVGAVILLSTFFNGCGSKSSSSQDQVIADLQQKLDEVKKATEDAKKVAPQVSVSSPAVRVVVNAHAQAGRGGSVSTVCAEIEQGEAVQKIAEAGSRVPTCVSSAEAKTARAKQVRAVAEAKAHMEHLEQVAIEKKRNVALVVIAYGRESGCAKSARQEAGEAKELAEEARKEYEEMAKE